MFRPLHFVQSAHVGMDKEVQKLVERLCTTRRDVMVLVDALSTLESTQVLFDVVYTQSYKKWGRPEIPTLDTTDNNHNAKITT